MRVHMPTTTNSNYVSLETSFGEGSLLSKLSASLPVEYPQYVGLFRNVHRISQTYCRQQTEPGLVLVLCQNSNGNWGVEFTYPSNNGRPIVEPEALDKKYPTIAS